MNDNQFVSRLGLVLVLLALVACGLNAYHVEVLKIRVANLETRVQFNESMIEKILTTQIRQEMIEAREPEYSFPSASQTETMKR
jgi:hypothetical protein